MDHGLKRYPVQSDAFHFNRLNVPFSAGCGFLVHQFCFLEGYRTCIHLAYHDLPFAVYNTKVEYITRLNQLGGSDDAPIDQDSAALDTLSGKFPSQVEVSGPQPLINTH